jgi:hypothetical protein
MSSATQIEPILTSTPDLSPHVHQATLSPLSSFDVKKQMLNFDNPKSTDPSEPNDGFT